jgi:hypothetical protein
MFRFTLTLLLVGLLGGCASVFNDKTQVVSVRAVCLERSVPANCVAENSRGRWAFRAPNEIVVAKDMYALKVTCKSVMVEQHTVHAPAVLQNAMAGNLLAGGVVGAAIDVGTGRGFAYPGNIDVSYPSCNVY